MEILIRKAAQEELAWVNEQYDKVQFRHSVFAQEFIAIAEVDGIRAGVGRLVSINDHALELGGMYVAVNYRGLGLARSLVAYLLRHAQQKTVYCLPFAHLEGFYTSCGFRPVTDTSSVPAKVLQKREWCLKTYPQPTLLLHLQV